MPLSGAEVFLCPLHATHPNAKDSAMCECEKKLNQLSSAEVPDFTTVGFTTGSEVVANAETLNAALATLQDVEALAIKGCVTGSVSGQQICFTLPILGRFCFTSPVPIPARAQVKVCFQSCGAILPTGAKVTVYVNGRAIFTKVIGRC